MELELNCKCNFQLIFEIHAKKRNIFQFVVFRIDQIKGFLRKISFKAIGRHLRN